MSADQSRSRIERITERLDRLGAILAPKALAELYN